MSHLESVRPHLTALDVTDKNWSAPLGVAQDQRPDVDLELSAMSTPIFTLDLDRIAANLEAMRAWVAEWGASLAPHGKTTMCPALWHWQLDAGCWAITVANEAQLRVARSAGIGRVVVANEFLSPHGLRWLAGELDADPDFDVTVWVDSVEGVQLMTTELAAAGAGRPLTVCVEVGYLGARGGVRDHGPALEIAKAVVESPRLALRGVSGYEGSVPGGTVEEKIAGVREFLSAMGEVFTEIAPLVETEEALLTAGGSALFDLVTEVLAPVAEAEPNTRLLLRSGAYIVHDDLLYAGSTPATTRSGPIFEPAANVWARVISTPEPTLALLDVGKRDVPYDAGLPVIKRVLRDGQLIDAPQTEFFNTNDQHGYVRLAQPGDLVIGDVVQLGLSHPCTMFDKWRSALLVEGEPPRVRGAVPTYF